MDSIFYAQLGSVALPSMIKKVGDSLFQEIRKEYRNMGLVFEPNWMLIVFLLEENPGMTVTQVSRKLGFSHPSVVSIVTRMKSHNYLMTTTDVNDSRRQHLELSKQCKKMMPALQDIWEKLNRYLSEYVEQPEKFLKNLIRLEENIQKSPFSEFE